MVFQPVFGENGAADAGGVETRVPGDVQGAGQVIVAGDDQYILHAFSQQRLGVFKVLPGIEGLVLHQDMLGIDALLLKPTLHHGGLCDRFILPLRAADDHRLGRSLIGLQRLQQAQLQLPGRLAVRVDLRAQHDDGLGIPRGGHIMLAHQQIGEQEGVYESKKHRQGKCQFKQCHDGSLSSPVCHASFLLSGRLE